MAYGEHECLLTYAIKHLDKKLIDYLFEVGLDLNQQSKLFNIIEMLINQFNEYSSTSNSGLSDQQRIIIDIIILFLDKGIIGKNALIFNSHYNIIEMLINQFNKYSSTNNPGLSDQQRIIIDIIKLFFDKGISRKDALIYNFNLILDKVNHIELLNVLTDEQKIFFEHYKDENFFASYYTLFMFTKFNDVSLIEFLLENQYDYNNYFTYISTDNIKIFELCIKYGLNPSETYYDEDEIEAISKEDAAWKGADKVLNYSYNTTILTAIVSKAYNIVRYLIQNYSVNLVQCLETYRAGCYLGYDCFSPTVHTFDIPIVKAFEICSSDIFQLLLSTLMPADMLHMVNKKTIAEHIEDYMNKLLHDKETRKEILRRHEDKNYENEMIEKFQIYKQFMGLAITSKLRF